MSIGCEDVDSLPITGSYVHSSSCLAWGLSTDIGYLSMDTFSLALPSLHPMWSRFHEAGTAICDLHTIDCYQPLNELLKASKAIFLTYITWLRLPHPTQRE